MSNLHAGADWIERQIYGKAISPLGRRVADLIGDAWLGIYHVDSDVRRVDWSDPWIIRMTTYGRGGQFATHDGDLLTRLVVLAHDRCIRMEIEPAGPKYLRITFHGRERSADSVCRRHPTIESAVAKLRDYYGPVRQVAA